MTNKDGSGQDNRTRALLHDLRTLGRLDAHDEAFGQDLRTRLLQQAHQQTTPHDERIPRMITTLDRPRTLASRRPPSIRLRVASVAAAVLLALSGLAGYLHWQTPTPVSAQSILRHTAAALHPVAADQVVHDVSTVHVVNAPGMNGGVSGLTAPDVTVDEWTQRDAQDEIVRQDTTFTDPAGTLLQHTVQNGQTLKSYDVQTQKTAVTTVTLSIPPQNQVIPNPFDTAALRQFVLDAQGGTNQEASVLPQQTVGGAAVYVVQVNHMLPAPPQGATATTMRRYTVTLYVDQSSYTIHKFEDVEFNARGDILNSATLQVVRHEVVSSAAVPPTVFSLHAPANGRVVTAPHTR